MSAAAARTAAERQAGLDRIGGAYDRHFGQGTQEGDVLAGMVRGTERGVRQPGADADDDAPAPGDNRRPRGSARRQRVVMNGVIV